MYSPLVLIDCIVIHDIDAILRVSPSKLDRIEIVNSPYILGNTLYGGIISLVSKNNDFAGADLPETGLFINYDFPLKDLPFPQDFVVSESNLPDVRNILYWNPGLIITEEKSIVQFRTCDLTGDYDIVIQSMGPDGKIIETRINFRVE